MSRCRGPEGLHIPNGLTRDEDNERLDTLAEFSKRYLERYRGTSQIEDCVAVARRRFDMMSPKFQSAFAVKDEPAACANRTERSSAGDFCRRAVRWKMESALWNAPYKQWTCGQPAIRFAPDTAFASLLRAVALPAST